MTSEELRNAVARLRAELGDDLCIAGHHYVRQDVIDFCDVRGDSLELARKVREVKARRIVFCGVYFMGESSALLAQPGQRVFLPSMDAECVMAKAAPADLVESVLGRLRAVGKRIVPIAYVNSSLAVKSVVGRFGGAVCTSANAGRMARWGLERGDALLFLPDRNLGRNVGRALGMDASEMHVLDVRGRGTRLDLTAAARASMLLWPAGCAVHQTIHPSHVEAARKAGNAVVIAHPECDPAVVAGCDASGSTTTLIRTVREAGPGSLVFVGTEANLVDRLAREAGDGVVVRPLRRCVCSNMAKVTLGALLGVLQGIKDGTADPVVIDERGADDARLALRRMLDACD